MPQGRPTFCMIFCICGFPVTPDFSKVWAEPVEPRALELVEVVRTPWQPWWTTLLPCRWDGMVLHLLGDLFTRNIHEESWISIFVGIYMIYLPGFLRMIVRYCEMPTEHTYITSYIHVPSFDHGDTLRGRHADDGRHGWYGGYGRHGRPWIWRTRCTRCRLDNWKRIGVYFTSTDTSKG